MSDHMRRSAATGLALSLLAVVLLTLTPTGQGWVWADPSDELSWYFSDPGSGATFVQWAGNLLLLAAPAGFAVVRWPGLGRPGAWVAVSLASAALIETLQRLLPLGRVVSPVDAALNAVGAVVAGLLVARACRGRVVSGGAEVGVGVRLSGEMVASGPPPHRSQGTDGDRGPFNRCGLLLPAGRSESRPVVSRSSKPRRGWRLPLATSLAGLLVLTGCGSDDLVGGVGSDNGSPTAPARSPSPAGPSKSTPSTTVRLSFGGDVMFEDELRELLDRPATSLAPINAATAAADFTMVNLESAVTTRGTRDPKELEDADNRYHFRTSPAALTALQAGGVDAVSIANNHGVDFGAEGLADTLRAKSTSTLPILGVGRDRTEAFTPHRVTLKGQPFAFLAADASFLESTEPYWQAGSAAGLAAARGAGRSALLASVEREAAAGAAVVIYLHWGKENSVDVTAEQQGLAQDLAAAGAAVVVGSHTHRLQAAGWLGSTYVAYGLGNFIWYHGNRGGETGLLDVTLVDGRVVADGFRPAVIPAAGGLPRFLTGASAAEATRNWRELRPGSQLAAEAPSPVAAPAAYAASVSPITASIRSRMASSYREGCPVPVSDLRYLRLSYWDFAGRVRQGELVVHAKHANALVEVFRKLYAAKFPIERMQLVSDYGGDDEKSMAANNTSAFNCRSVAGTDRWSQHSFGAAIDLNPVQNPYVTEAGVSPEAGEAYAKSGARRPGVQGLITADSVVVRAFRDVGWEWGGDWTSPKDYQHFSAAGS